MRNPYQKWARQNKDDIDELFRIFTGHFPECKAVYRDFCILLYNKSHIITIGEIFNKLNLS